MKFEAGPPKLELDERIAHLQQPLKDNHVDGALIMQNMDLYYFAGTIQQAFLYVPAEGKALLMVRKDIMRACEESTLTNIVELNSLKQLPELLSQNGCELPATLGLELDVLPVNTYQSIQGILPKTGLVDISHAIRLIRSVKSAYEIELIQRAAHLSDQVAAAVPDMVQVGMTEIELAGRLEAEARRLGHQGLVRMRLWNSELFYGHVMAGPAAAVPSYLSSPTGGLGVGPAVAQGAGQRPILAHEPILVDFVFIYQGYVSDHTRIFAIGELDKELMEGYAVMHDIQTLLKKEALPGRPAGELYDLALDWVCAKGYETHFMGNGDKRIRFVGHGVGLELDEYPFLARGQKLPLAEGMVIAIEPKLVIPGKGVVGIENTHVVTATGLRQFGGFREDIVIID